MIIDWIANIFSLLGAMEGARYKPKIKAFRMNLFYVIGNIIGLVYFIITFQKSFIILYCGYLLIVNIGLINNRKRKKEDLNGYHHVACPNSPYVYWIRFYPRKVEVKYRQSINGITTIRYDRSDL